MTPTAGPFRGPNPAFALSIRIVGHGLPAGAGAFTLTTTGVLPAPLAAATSYYSIAVDADHIQLASSRANALAGTAITLTDAGSGVHTLVTGAATEAPVALVFVDTFTTDFNDAFVFPSTVPTALDRLDGPLRLTTTGTLPNGLLAATDYWIVSGVADTVTLATSFANALAGLPVPFSDDGAGVHTITAQAGAQHYEPITLPESTFTVG